MKTDLEHLPIKKQKELARVKEILFEEFDKAMAGGSQDWRRTGRMQWIILFGSYARGDWVDEPHTTKGYKSDYDILIIVSHKKIIEMTNLWDDLEQRLLRDKSLKTPVTFILESHKSINDALVKGQYFFSDIRKQGIALHQTPNARLSPARPLTDQDAYITAKEFFENSLSTSKNYFTLSDDALKRVMLNEAAFLIHQSVEQAYSALLLTLTSYSPPTHRITALRSFAEDLDRSLIDIWPRDSKKERATFNKLAEAYVKARYSKHYAITAEELDWLSTQTTHLHTRIEKTCQIHLTKLKIKAE